MALARDTEIRKLRPAELYTLGQILNISDSWKKLMAVVPKEGCENIPRFNSEHFTLIENAVQGQRRSAAEIFLDEWGTMGRRRPTLGILLDLLVQAELFRAADYIAVDILKGELPKRPECGPAAAVDISDETIIRLLREQADLSSNTFDESSVILGTSLEHNVDKITYLSERSLNAMESNNANLQSTKLASVNHDLSIKGSNSREYYGGNREIAEYTPVSDLMKFSSAELPNLSVLRLHDSHQSFLPPNTADSKQMSENNNMPACVQNFVSPKQIHDNREMLSAELPAVLNDIRQTGNVHNYEIRTEELPACLNSQFMTINSTLSDATSSNNSSSISDSSDNSLRHENDEQILELNSAELPQCVIELKHDSTQNNTTEYDKPKEYITSHGNGLESQELPVMVVEYNKVS